MLAWSPAYQLIGYISVILSSKLLSDSRLHESGKRGQDIDRGVDLLVVELTIDEDLALCDITSQIRDRVGNICGLARRSP